MLGLRGTASVGTVILLTSLGLRYGWVRNDYRDDSRSLGDSLQVNDTNAASTDDADLDFLSFVFLRCHGK